METSKLLSESDYDLVIPKRLYRMTPLSAKQRLDIANGTMYWVNGNEPIPEVVEWLKENGIDFHFNYIQNLSPTMYFKTNKDRLFFKMKWSV